MGEVTMSANNQSAQGGDNHINLYEPHVWKHHTKVAGLEWKNPVGTASGTFQYAAVRWFYDVSQLGAVCTKGASPVPWEGNPSPRTAESPAANINAVGLQNPGIDHYLAEDCPSSRPRARSSSPMSPDIAMTITRRSWKSSPTPTRTCWKSTSAARTFPPAA